MKNLDKEKTLKEAERIKKALISSTNPDLGLQDGDIEIKFVKEDDIYEITILKGRTVDYVEGKGAHVKNVSKVILSSGISNNCHSISTVKDQLFYLSVKPVNIILLGNNNCNGANDTLKLMCSKYSNCKFESIPYGRDGIHPNQYNKKF